MAVEQSELQLPISVVGYSDVGHLLTEAENVDNFLRQGAIRETGTPMQLPKTSKLLEELVEANKLNLLEEQDRAILLNLLKAVRTKAPVIHMSFNNDPSAIFLQRLVTWMRQQLHPFVLLQIGLNPSIGAGCTMRTTNRHFDFSLRHRFTEQRDLLMYKLKGVPDTEIEGTETVEATTEAMATTEAEVAAGVPAAESATDVPSAPPVPAEAETEESVEAAVEAATEALVKETAS